MAECPRPLLLVNRVIQHDVPVVSQLGILIRWALELPLSGAALCA